MSNATKQALSEMQLLIIADITDSLVSPALAAAMQAIADWTDDETTGSRPLTTDLNGAVIYAS